MGGRSSGSVMQIETGSGKKSGGRKRGSASNGRTRKDEEGGNGTMARTRSGREKKNFEEKRPWRKRGMKTWQASLTPRSWRSLPRRTKRQKVLKKRECEIR